MAKPLHRSKFSSETTRTAILKRTASFPVTPSTSSKWKSKSNIITALATINVDNAHATNESTNITSKTAVTSGLNSASDSNVCYPYEPYFISMRPRSSSRSGTRSRSRHCSETTPTSKDKSIIRNHDQHEGEPLSPKCQMVTNTTQQHKTHAESEITQFNASKTFDVVRRDSICSEPSVKLTWMPLAPLGPPAAFHVCACINNNLYVHGGITESLLSPKPSKQFFKINLTTLLWEKIATKGSPALSHHASVVLEDRYFVVIGGWDGKKRHAGISVYDTVEDVWTRMSCKGFPLGAGLSSHTATLTSNGDVIVIGREGSLHTQRRHGNMYILSGDVASGQFVYRPFTNNVISRSGHTVNLIGKDLYILGGRSDHLFEKYVGIKHTKKLTCKLLDDIWKAVASSGVSSLAKLPCGRKHHISAANAKFILMHGGETFDGKAHEPVGEMFLICLKPTTKFFKLRSSGFCRSGHACIVLPNRILVHGGQSGKGEIHSGLYELVLE